jgi:hypothetical protein
LLAEEEAVEFDIQPDEVSDQESEAETDDGTYDGDLFRCAVGAGLVTGLCGLMLTGPLMAACLGISAAYAAQSDPGVVGESARVLGDAVLEAKAKAEEVEEETQFTQRVSDFCSRQMDEMNEFCREKIC